ncbi:MAG: methylenetetrahydrofolate reductase C-terminal domain-containing protein [Candidatus Altiarchaeota archaeon]|nr:methylenetetrahydrofolate reductase C-terminal domain-containing protein [Candidatus Altiarchaeota archaeon]
MEKNPAENAYEIAGYDVRKLCAKRLLNGPCGGVRNGKCEVGDAPCVWVMIYGKMRSGNSMGEFAGVRLPASMQART